MSLLDIINSFFFRSCYNSINKSFLLNDSLVQKLNMRHEDPMINSVDLYNRALRLEIIISSIFFILLSCPENNVQF